MTIKYEVMKVCFSTVLYEQGLQYISDYIHSLQSQTYNDFEILFINQDIKNIENILQRIKGKLNFRVFDGKSSTPSYKNIQQIIDLNLQFKTDIIIFGDMDDYFAPNRIEEIIAKIDNVCIAFHDLLLVNSHGKLLSNKGFIGRKLTDLKEGQIWKINRVFPILHKNLIGLSNSAINISKINFDILIPETTNAVDWALFTIILINDCSAIYINTPLSYYRQHTNNSIGDGTHLNEEKIIRGVYVKLKHYQYFRTIPSDYQNQFAKLYSHFEGLYSKLLNQEKFREKYIESQKRKLQTGYYVWWENYT